jgi:maltose/moltooligosaccharide transporter
MVATALDELRRPTLWAIAVAFGAITMMWTTYNEYVPDFLRTVFGAPVLLIALLLTMDNLLGFFLEPLVGLVSDRTRTAWGKRLPWLMLALPIGAIAFALIPLPIQALAPNAGEAARDQAYSPFAFAVIGMMAAMAITRTPTTTLMPDLIAPPHRAVAHGLIQMWAGIGGLGALYTGAWLIDVFGISGPFWAASLVMIVALGWMWWLLHNHQIEDDGIANTPNGLSQWRLVAVVLLLWLGYLTVVNRLAPAVGLDGAQDGFLQKLWMVVFTIAALPSGFVENTVRAIQVGIGILIGALLLILIIPGNELGYALFMGLGGVGWALVTVNSLPLLINAGPESKNGRSTGLYYLAFALAGLVTPWLLRGVDPFIGGAALWLAPVAWGIALALMSTRPPIRRSEPL